MRVFLSILLFALALAGQSLSGRRAPSFSLPDSNQTQHDILDYRGKWLLLNYTTSMGCPDCGPFAKLLDQVKARVANTAVLFVMLAPPENANTAGRFIVDNKLTQPVVFDQSQTAIAYFKATPTRSQIDTPHLFIINPSGIIVRDYSNSGLTDFLQGKGDLAKYIQGLMTGTAK